jgi:uncharacterized protein involved in outer membrane biogenesis
MKKALKWIGIPVGLIALVLFVAPFVIRVDQFRPELVRVANEHLNGKLELGRLDLTLWGRIRVAIDGLKVIDRAGKEVLSVKDAAFDLPFASVFSGSPTITLKLKAPSITVLRDSTGKWNALDLVKGLNASTPAPGTPATKTAEASGPAPALPALVLNARFGLSVEDARLSTEDRTSGLSNTIENLNLEVRDLSLSRKTDIELWATLRTKLQDLRVEGPIRLKVGILPELKDGAFKSATIETNASADELEIEKGVLFKKSKGIPANFSMKASADTAGVQIRESLLRFHNASVALTGKVEATGPLSLKVEAKPVELAPWSELVPMLKAYELSGRFTLNAEAGGKPDALTYSAKMVFDGVSAKGPGLKAKPVLNGKVEVATDRIEKFLFDLTGPGNELRLEGSLNHFLKPEVRFSLTSPKGMDLDQWVVFPEPVASPKTKGTAEPAAPSAKAPEEDFDALLAPLRSNPIARGTDLQGTFLFSFIKAKGIRIEDLGGKVTMKNLSLALSAFKMRIYGGTLTGGMTLDLLPAEPRYSLKFALREFDLQKAVEAQMAAFKNTVVGKLSASIEGAGSSFNPGPAKKKIDLKGEFKIVDGAFLAFDVAKMANEAINGSIGKVAEKVPVLKGQSFQVNSRADSRYESISGHFKIAGGVLTAPDFFAKAAPKRGIDLKGSTRMGLVDESIDAKWELIDRERVTGADQLKVSIAGRTIPNFLAKGENEPVILPVTVGCKWTAPCVSYTEVPEYLGRVAAARIGKGAEEAAKDLVKEKAKEAAKEAVGKALKGLFGR